MTNNNKKKLTKASKLALIVLVVLLGYFFLQRRSSNGSSPLTSVVKPIASPLPPIDTWKTYENTVYNFSIKYPPDWSLNVYGGFPNDEISPSKVTGLDPSFVTLAGGSNMGIGISINPEGYFGDQYGLMESSKVSTAFIDGIEVDVYEKDPMGIRYINRLYTNFGINWLPDFSIVATYRDRDVETLEKVMSTMTIDN